MKTATMNIDLTGAGEAVLPVNHGKPVLIVKAESKQSASSAQTVMSSYGTKTVGFSTHVPEGYTCIGNQGGYISRTGGGLAAVQAGDSASVTYRNTSSQAITMSGQESGGYYCLFIAYLICVRSDLLEA